MNLDADGFDHYGTVDYVGKYWSGTPTSIENGKTSTGPGVGSLAQKAVGLANTSITRVFGGESSQLICGFAFFASTLNDAVIFTFKESSTDLVGLQLTSAGTLKVFREFTFNVIGTCSGTGILAGTWNYIEIKCTFDSIVGSVQVRKNGVEIFNQTGINTDPAGGSICNAISLGGTASFPFPALRFDDLYLNDTSGTQNNDFEGEVLIDTLPPVSNSTPLDFVPSTGTNYECVDNVPPVELTEFVAAATTADADAYFGPNYIRVVQSIRCIRTVNFAKKTGAGVADLKHRIKSNATVVSSDPIALTVDYLYSSVLWEKNPDGNVAWEPATVSPGNNFNFGPEVG